MASFPALAQAEENSGIQYETDVPTVPDDGSSNIPSKDPGGSDAPDESDPDTPTSNAPGGAGTGGGDGDSGTGGGADKGQTNPGSGGGGEQGVGGSKPAAGQEGQAKAIELTPASDLSASNDDEDSSPLVPILIAIAVLAAISVGAFYYRQRRQDDAGSPISPKAS
ncbi:MAG: hypothetical protein M3335_08145 [Actinomycetota bacterium]|nr:hypothetical protein [Actinomycetota bacterium]